MKVLVFAPHPDDESIALGGTIRRHVLLGCQVKVLFLTSGEAAPESWTELREQEAKSAQEILGYQEIEFWRYPDGHLEEASGVMERIFEELEKGWDVVYLPHKNDAHPDHSATHKLVMEALNQQSANGSPLPADMAMYEVWTPLQEYDINVRITDHVEDKLAAIRAHKSQSDRNAFDMGAIGLNRFRGVMLGKPTDYVEVFQRIHV